MNTRTLDDETIDKIVKLLAMTTSSFAGERDNAVMKANAILRERKLTWRDVIAPPLVPHHPEPPPWWQRERDDLAGWEIKLAFCLTMLGRLGDRERDFIMSLEGWIGEPSRKQIKWLNDIFARLGRRP